MPKMDDGTTDGPPGRDLQTVWAELSHEEAHELLESLNIWVEEIDGGQPDPGWHSHIADEEGRELTISIRLPGHASIRRPG